MLSAYMALIDDKALCSEFEKLYYNSRITAMKTAVSILHSSALAEEAVSESYFKLAKCFQKVHSLPSHKLRSYLVITVKNTALTMLRKETAVETVEYDDELDHSPLPDAGTERLNECISQLSDTDKEVLYLRVTLDLEYDEIASALNISQEAARARLSYARKKLRRLLEDIGNE
ncbi:MAG: sigma-70 family RNA polymerase sigma factor [Ruminococcus sp.]|nr:sigma-70 family RNA polymerase sigma factor [Ruminococcus sp.]